ncbi:MAG: T9SS type A sorting domain-containing protein [Saprospiraceae bacterium]|nr:MAG: T9SS type A sorting domain-containing protein [Saprospiraceae bacterium]
MKSIFTTCFALLTVAILTAQSANFWQDVSESQINLPENTSPAIVPLHYRTLALDLDALRNFLREAPMEFTDAARNAPLVLQFPMPDGQMDDFAVWESPIMAPGLAARFPMIKTFAGKSLQNPAVNLRFDYTTKGFNAIIQTAQGTALITPFADGQDSYYTSFFIKDVNFGSQEEVDFFCGLDDANLEELPGDHTLHLGELTPGKRANAVVDLQTYRLAIATTAEYSTKTGGTTVSVLSAVTTVVNNINNVFENDNAIRLVLIDSTTKTFFFPPNGADPYTNGNTDDMINENPAQLNIAYGVTGYDIGHVFGTNGGGLAQLASVCNGSSLPPAPFPKARGASCRFGPYDGPLFYIVAGHEMGHQFSATHNFNKCDDENENPPTAYEPGSGSTIMDYNGNGVCGSNHLQPTSDDYFHVNALERIQNFSRSGSGSVCAQTIAAGNTAPEATIPIAGGFYIPISTPFQLTGTATDAGGDALTYVWEEYDLGPASPLGFPEGTAPLFRSNIPGSSPTRVFPKLSTILSNTNDPQEVLPTITRPLTFRFTARDNHAGAGAWDFAEIQFNATASAGPFVVSNPNSAATTWEVGQSAEVNWEVASTDAAPVNCKKVNILLSTDGGLTFPITLLPETLNDGSAFVVVPNVLTTQARIRVDAADNIFFDISNENFSIVNPAAPTFLFSTSESGNTCIPEPFITEITTESLLGFSEIITLTVDGLPAGATASFSANPINPGETATMTIDVTNVAGSGSFVLTVSGTANGVPAAERSLTLNIVSSDFSGLAAIAPADGASGQSTLPAFEWTGLPNAASYEIEIATSPLFGAAVIETASGLTANTYALANTLEDNTIYYWRLRPSNECGMGEFTDPASFHTVAQSCESKLSTGGSINIPGGGLPLIHSIINIPQSGTISEVKVKNVKGNHTAVAHIELRLKGPSGDSVVLMSGLLCGSPLFDLGFFDLAPPTPLPCPPNTGNLYQPAEPLSIFNGQDVQGDWSLDLEVINTQGEGGTFNSWEFEYCAAFNPKNPFIVTNDTLAVPPNGSRPIYSDKLLVNDDDNTSSELQFTIVTNTASGFVSLGGVQLGAGSHFTMHDIETSQVEYTNTDSTAVYDYFTFGVSDGEGGYFGTPRFILKMDPNAPSATHEVGDAANVLLYPNPATDNVTVEFVRPVTGAVVATLLNANGQHLLSQDFDGSTPKFVLKTQALPAGVYFVQLTTPNVVYTKKVILE